MKKRLPILILLITTFLIAPFSVNAGFWDWDDLPAKFVAFVMGALVDLAGNFARITGALLDWVVSPAFISFSYTNPSGPNANLIVEVGLNITKNFVNLGLVIVLIFIALSISLQIKDYGSKKMLVNLIIVALLVNFAPVLVGLIVDASNITMNFFLNGIKNGISTALSDLNSEGLIGALTRPGSVTPNSLLVRGAVMIALYSSIGLAFLLMTFVFVLRYIMIWVLVILSPLAFVAWIIPPTKKYWTMWWNQVIQWSFIGIPMAFFLYLAARAVPEIKGRFVTQVVIPGAEQSIVGIVDQTFPYFVIIIFVYLGFFMGLKGGAAGSSMAINFAKRTGRAGAGAGAWVGKRAGQGSLNYLKDARISASTKTKEEREASGKKMYDPARYIKRITPREEAEKLSHSWDKAPVLRWFRPEGLEKFGEHKEAMDAIGEMTGPTAENMERFSNGKFTGAKAAKTIFDTVKTRGDSQDIIKYYGKKYKHLDENGNVNEEELFKDDKFIHNKQLNLAFDYLQRAGKKGTLLRVDPRLARIGETKEKGLSEMVRHLSDAKPGDVSNWEKEVPDNEKLTEASMAVQGEDFFRSTAKLKGGTLARKHTMQKVYSKWIEKEGLNKKDNIDNQKKFFKYLADKYHVETAGIEMAFKNQRFQSLGYGKGLSYMDELKRAIKPGTVASAINSSAPSGPTPEAKENIVKDKNWNNKMAARSQTEKEARKNAENAEARRKAEKKRDQNPKTGMDNKRNK